MRANINATLVFGLVSVPVGVATAAARKEARFNQLHKECGQRITLQKTCPEHGELRDDEVTRGYEYAKGQFLEFDNEELEQVVAEPTKLIQLNKFVPEPEVRPFLEKDYYLIPNEAMAQQYLLLYNALRKTKLCGIGASILWGVEKPCAVRATEDGIVLSMLFCHDEVRSAAEIREFLIVKRTTKAEQELANEIVKVRSGHLNPEEDLVSESAQRVTDFIGSKLEGTEMRPLQARDVPDVTPDLLLTLRASLEEAKAAA